jgi:hypothetical protein
MKSTEIHNGLPEKEIRDFFAKSMSGMFDKECANKKVEISYDRTNPFDWSIKNDEAQIVVLKRNIELAHQKIALHDLLKDKGWDEWDVSDYTFNDSGFKLHLSFIGTKEEYDQIMIKLQKV